MGLGERIHPLTQLRHPVTNDTGLLHERPGTDPAKPWALGKMACVILSGVRRPNALQRFDTSHLL